MLKKTHTQQLWRCSTQALLWDLRSCLGKVPSWTLRSQLLVQFIDSLGHRGARVHTDGEPPIRTIAGRRQRQRPRTTWRWVISPVTLSRHTSTFKSVVEMNYGTRVGPSHNLWPWCESLRGAETVFEFVRTNLACASFLSKYRGETVIFGEGVLFTKPVGHTGHRARLRRMRKADLHWTVGVWLGTASLSVEHLIGTSFGTQSAEPSDDEVSPRTIQSRGS